MYHRGGHHQQPSMSNHAISMQDIKDNPKNTAMVVSVVIIGIFSVTGVVLGAVALGQESSSNSKAIDIMRAGSLMAHHYQVGQIIDTAPFRNVNGNLNKDKFENLADEMYDEFFRKECFTHGFRITTFPNADFETAAIAHLSPVECMHRYADLCSVLYTSNIQDGVDGATETRGADDGGSYWCQLDLVDDVAKLLEDSDPPKDKTSSKHKHCWRNLCDNAGASSPSHYTIEAINADNPSLEEEQKFAHCELTSDKTGKNIAPKDRATDCNAATSAEALVFTQIDDGANPAQGIPGAWNVGPSSDTTKCTCYEYTYFKKQCDHYDDADRYPEEVFGMECSAIRND